MGRDGVRSGLVVKVGKGGFVNGRCEEMKSEAGEKNKVRIGVWKSLEQTRLV